MIKNIIFDLSEVIVSGYHGIEKIVEENTNISAKEVLQRKQETLNLFFETMRGKYSEEQYLTYLLDEMNWEISPEILKKLIRQGLNQPIRGTMQIIKKLQNNYRLILLSDHVKEWKSYIFENNGELEIFEHQYFSYDYGLLKSDEGCFDYILKDLKIKAEETIFIDDYEANIKMAKQCGIEGILFKSAEDLEENLKKRGIL